MLATSKFVQSLMTVRTQIADANPVPASYLVKDLANLVGIGAWDVLNWTAEIPGLVWWHSGHRFREFVALKGWLALHDADAGDTEIVLPRAGHEERLAAALQVEVGEIGGGGRRGGR